MRGVLYPVIEDENNSGRNELLKLYKQLSDWERFFKTRKEMLDKAIANAKIAEWPETRISPFRDAAISVELMIAAIEDLRKAINFSRWIKWGYDKRQQPHIDKLKTLIRSIEAVMKTEKEWNPTSENEVQLNSADKTIVPFTTVGNIQYDVDKLQLWTRRVKLLTLFAIAVGVGFSLSLLFTTPGLHIPAAIKSIPVAFYAALAFLGLCPTPLKSSTIDVGPMQVTATVPIAFSIGGFLGAIYTAISTRSLIAKASVSPTREVVAAIAQTATINFQFLELRKKIEGIDGDQDVKEFLLKVVIAAGDLYVRGTKRMFHEFRQSDQDKALLILRATSLVVNGEIPTNVQTLLEKEVLGGKTYQLIITAQRNTTPGLWGKTSLEKKLDPKFQMLINQNGARTTVDELKLLTGGATPRV